LNHQEQEALMRNYKQLDQEPRDRIYAYRKVGKSHIEITQEIGVDPATISRELRRHIKENQAIGPIKPIRKPWLVAKMPRSRLRWQPRSLDWRETQDWSPEQIAGTMKHRGIFNQPWAHLSIYLARSAPKRLYKHLGWNQKKRPKRYGSENSRDQIKNRLMIDQCPKEVEAKSRIGDWSIDPVIGANP